VSTALDLAGWQTHAARLAAHLTESGALTDPAWREAWEQTPRHVFVPRVYQDGQPVTATDVTHRGWLDLIYRDEQIVTQCVPVANVARPWPTSSSSMPSLMSRMLELLAVTDRSRVLEIGTGTGYNAALLCHRLGDQQVASVELHPDVAADAAERLALLSYHPRLAVGDGAQGDPEGAPSDRVIATCAVPAVPLPWIEQLAVGGRIVLDLHSEMSSSLAVLDKPDHGIAHGRLLAQRGNFMWLRPQAEHPLRDPHRFELAIDHADAETHHLDVDLAALNDPGFRVLLGALEPTLGSPSRSQPNGVETWWMHAEGGAWIEITPGTVTQGGPRQLWDDIVNALTEWRRLGRPGRGDYGLTITDDGVHHYWTDDGDQRRFVNMALAVRSGSGPLCVNGVSDL
jgi:protein-L-isoaspartate O-methyltransferase